MSENITKPTKVSVSTFLKSVENDTRREDARVLLKLMEKLTGEKAKMWGPSIIGFGSYHYTYDSGREGDMCMTGFSPRKASLSIYVMGDFKDKAPLLARLGKHKTGKSCLYVNKLADVDMGVLEKLIKASVKHMRAKYGC